MQSCTRILSRICGRTVWRRYPASLNQWRSTVTSQGEGRIGELDAFGAQTILPEQAAPCEQDVNPTKAGEPAASLPLPQRIILLRHGEPQENRNADASKRMPEWKVPLTPRGMSQARRAGLRLHTIVGDDPVYIYHSPYLRAVQTTVEVLKGLDPSQVKGVREEPRMAEQQFGNLSDMATIQKSIEDRVRFGRFFYRFPNGEAGLDVYTRVSGFIGTLRHARLGPGSTVVVVTHGLAIRLFLMRWFQWTVEQFEVTRNPGLCDMAVMELVPEEGTYRLTDMTLKILGAEDAPTTSPLGRAVYSRAFVDAFLSY